jgi:hypothetical protein
MQSLSSKVHTLRRNIAFWTAQFSQKNVCIDKRVFHIAILWDIGIQTVVSKDGSEALIQLGLDFLDVWGEPQEQ